MCRTALLTRRRPESVSRARSTIYRTLFAPMKTPPSSHDTCMDEPAPILPEIESSNFLLNFGFDEKRLAQYLTLSLTAKKLKGRFRGFCSLGKIVSPLDASRLSKGAPPRRESLYPAYPSPLRISRKISNQPIGPSSVKPLKPIAPGPRSLNCFSGTTAKRQRSGSRYETSCSTIVCEALSNTSEI